MIPPTPLPFAVFGPALYAELYVGLCRALAAPWLAAYSLGAASGPRRDRGAPPTPAPVEAQAATSNVEPDRPARI